MMTIQAAGTVTIRRISRLSDRTTGLINAPQTEQDVYLPYGGYTALPREHATDQRRACLT